MRRPTSFSRSRTSIRGEFAARDVRSACRPTRATGSSVVSTSNRARARSSVSPTHHRARRAGESTAPPVDLAYGAAAAARIALRTSRVARLLGETGRRTRSPTSRSFGFRVAAWRGDLSVAAPTWRGDVTGEADLIEEVARLRGYDSFPVEIAPFRAGHVGDDPQWITSKRVREALVGAGLIEARPMPSSPGGEGFVRVTQPARRERGVSAPRDSRHARPSCRVQFGADAGQCAAVRDRVGVRAARRWNCRSKSCASACS